MTTKESLPENVKAALLLTLSAAELERCTARNIDPIDWVLERNKLAAEREGLAAPSDEES